MTNSYTLEVFYIHRDARIRIFLKGNLDIKEPIDQLQDIMSNNENEKYLI